MVYLNCDLCGQPALPFDRPVLICSTCKAKFEELLCRECGERVGYAVDAKKPAYFNAGLCWMCHMRKRLVDVPEPDREAIRLAAANGTFAGIVQVRKRLGWSIHDSTDAVVPCWLMPDSALQRIPAASVTVCKSVAAGSAELGR